MTPRGHCTTINIGILKTLGVPFASPSLTQFRGTLMKTLKGSAGKQRGLIEGRKKEREWQRGRVRQRQRAQIIRIYVGPGFGEGINVRHYSGEIAFTSLSPRSMGARGGRPLESCPCAPAHRVPIASPTISLIFSH